MSYGRGVFQTPFGNLRPFTALAAYTKSADPCVGNVFTLNNVSTGVYTSLSWSFPGGTPATSTDENPVVTYPSVGNYSATLTITNAASATSTVSIPINVTRMDNCSVDPIADKALQTTADGDYFVKTGANLTNVTSFTTTAWIKPNGAQAAYAGIVSNGEWCAHCNTNTNGLVFDYYGTKLWYRWAGVDDTWANNSGMTVPLNQWSYVAMVVTPDSVAIYLNDQKYVHVFAGTEDRPTAATITDLYMGYGHYNGYFKGLIDEVRIWNSALTQNDIRDMRHLTKENVMADANLKAYFQFDELVGDKILDKARVYHGTLQGNAALATSTAPIGSGLSQRLNVASGGIKSFGTPQVDIEFPSTGTFPNGEVVVTRLNTAPDQTPTGGTPLSNPYWIVNNYGINQIFTPLTSLKFNNVVGLTSPAANFKLYKRTANAEGATWGTTIDGADNLVSNALTLTPAIACMGITNFGQFALTDDAATAPPSVATAECAASTVVGKAMSLSANGQYMLTPAIDLGSSTDQITIMAWIRPNAGTQSSYAGILSCNGINVNLNYRDNNELGIHWNDAQYSWSSGLTVTPNEWSHVAFVVAGNRFRLYLNGKEAPNAAGNTADPVALNLANRQWYIGNDRGNTGRTFKGSIDEVCFYNRTLTQAEIQEQMHFVKTPSTDATLKGYFQFNETTGVIWNKADVNTTSFSGGATNITSSAPVATGTSQRMGITTSGVKDFPNQHLSLDFANGSTLPNGDIVVSELNGAPDENPTGGTPLSTKYWIVNNYGVNTGLTLNSLSFNNLTGFATGSPANYNLFKRKSGYDATSTSPSWGNALDVADALTNTNNKTLTFSTGNNVTSFSQFTISSISVLAVELLNFNAVLKNNQVDLTWQVADEKDVNHYIIERSFDGKSFDFLTKEEKSKLSSQDGTPQYGTNYYRLKIVENDGKATYSPIRSVVFNEKSKTDFKIYPNPTADILNIQFNGDKEHDTHIELIDNLGRRVYQYKFTSRIGNNHLFFPTSQFTQGLYSLKIKQENTETIEKIVIQ
jgi:PKD repeat protein